MRIRRLGGALLLALSLGVAVLLGPWAARWFLAAFWLLAASLFCYLGLQLRHAEPAMRALDTRQRPGRRPVFALALGFTSLAAATAVRALAGGRAVLVWILYTLAAIGMVVAFVLEPSARQDSSTR
jgi:hypothetical protein